MVNAVAQFQLKSYKSSQHTFKYPRKNHHDYLQIHTKPISTRNLSSHQNSKNFLNIGAVAVTIHCKCHRCSETEQWCLWL